MPMIIIHSLKYAIEMPVIVSKWQIHINMAYRLDKVNAERF